MTSWDRELSAVLFLEGGSISSLGCLGRGQLLGSRELWSFQEGSPSWHVAWNEGGGKDLVKSWN